MLFSDYINIPCNTTPDSPYREFIDVTNGKLNTITIRFRYGSANLCGIRLLYAEFQFCPLSLGQWVISSTDSYVFSADLTITDVPHQITVECFNIDDTFDHHVWVALDMSRETYPGMSNISITI